MSERRLVVGILERSLAWNRVLDQIGVAVERVTDPSAVSPATHSAIIVNRVLDDRGLKGIEKYVREGGSVIDAGPLMVRLDKGALRSRWFGTVCPDLADRDFGTVGLADIELRLRAHRDASHLDGLVAVLPLGEGTVIHLPLPLDQLLLDTAVRRRSFPADTPRPPNERVARIAKGEIRHIVDAALRMAHFRAGLPYLHRRWLPGRAQGVLCYRIDSDSGSREQVLALHRAAEAQKMRLTWFLHAEAHEGWLDLFTSFEGDELGLHGYRHATYETVEENLVNQREAQRTLHAVGLEPAGLAAPYGMWNTALANTVELLGLRYSSEFALDYNDLPFHPLVDGREAGALQLPIHPICIGSLRIAHATPEQMALYFREVVDRTAALREPTLLYHHPTHEHVEVMADTLGYARESGLESWTMEELAAWWREREKMRFTGLQGGESLTLTPHGGASETVMIEIEQPGEHVLLSLDREQSIRYDSLVWIPSTTPLTVSTEGRELRRPSLHRAVRTVEHTIHRAR